MLSDLEIALVLRVEEIPDPLTVNLHVADLDVKCEDASGLVTNACKELATEPWDDSDLFAVSHHRVTLARTCLPIRKETCIVTLKGVIQHLLANVIVHLFLRHKVSITTVK